MKERFPIARRNKKERKYNTEQLKLYACELSNSLPHHTVLCGYTVDHRSPLNPMA